jgi:hypothetical protein
MRNFRRRISLFPTIIGALFALNLFAFTAPAVSAEEQLPGKKCWAETPSNPAGCYGCEHLCWSCNGC